MSTAAAVAGFPLSVVQAHRLALVGAGERGLGVTGAIAVRATAGTLDAGRLERALAAVVACHEVLRTTLRTVAGLAQPLQAFGDAGFSWAFERALAAGELERATSGPAWSDLAAELAALARADGASAPRPLVAGLLRSADDPARAVVALRLSALVADGATLDLLIDELARSLDGRCDGESFQYADFAAWQLDLADAPETEGAREHWRRIGREALLPAPLPFERTPDPRSEPEVASPFEPITCRVRLAPTASPGALDEAFLLAAWATVLARLAGDVALEADIAVAALSDGRDFEELVGALGAFDQPLPAVVRVALGERFEQTVRRAARALEQARGAAAGFSWSRIGEALGVDVRHPRFGFEVGRALDPGAEPRRGGGFELALVARSVEVERADLALAVALDARDATAATIATIEVRADAARFERADVERIAGWFATLWSDAAARPTAPCGDLALASAGERATWQAEIARNQVELPFAPIPELVRRMAERTPASVAVEAEDGALSYADLLAAAARIARRLVDLGVEPDEPVGVFVERSPAMIAALLGILGAGAGYLPLDPDHPEERRAGILDEIAPRAVVASAALAPLLPERAFARVVLEDLAAETEATFVVRPVPLSSLAYVIHTSGSTGRPKGVAVAHGAIANRLLWMQRLFPLAPGDRVLHKTPISFDASIWEIFGPLLAGATVVLARPGGHQDSAYLAARAAAAGVTRLQLVPSQLAPFLDEPDGAGCTALRDLFCGGEALPPSLADRLAEVLPGVRLHNLYGPTEAAIDATCRPLVGPGLRRVPIGRPIDNVAIHLLNPLGQAVPDGLPGELAIGGAGLARGYVGRPEQTAIRFVPDPFSGAVGARLYRTGDFARRDLDGEIHYLGRIDRQVKIRGVRIELGEIEAVLADAPGVSRAVVDARAEPGGEGKRLLAWVVPASPATVADLDVAELRQRLLDRLPTAMVPASIMALAELPKLPNGKLDGAALPLPESVAATSGRSDAPPRTPTEELLAALFAEVLEVPRVGRHDDFFDLGGHSLRATQLVSRVRKAFQVELPVRELFRAPTVAGLAVRLEEIGRAADALAAPPLRAVRGLAGGDRPLPLSFAQSRLWFFDRLHPRSPFFNLPMAIRLAGRLDRPVLERTLTEIVRRHQTLRTTFGLGADEEPEQRVGPPVPVRARLADLSRLPQTSARPSSEITRLLARLGARPFDLARGPLLRATLLRLGAEEHVGLLELHHIASDGWSTGVLVSEVAALYAAFAAGRPSPLPELPLQYADFALWQRGWLQGEALEAQLAWWRERLAGAPERLDMPLDRPRPAALGFRGDSASRFAPAGLGAALADVARRLGATTFMVAFAAGSLLLAGWAGQRDLVVGTDIANRNREETEGLIGFFVNQLALRVRVAPGATFRDLLGQVREAALGAYAHQDLPFEQVVQAVAPERSRAWSPLFQVKVNLHNTRALALDLPGLTISPLPVERTTAQLELILHVVEGEEGRLQLSADYSTELFDRSTIESLLESFERVLGAVVARPDLPVDELIEELAGAERERQLARQQEKRRARGEKLGGPRRGPAPALDRSDDAR